MATAFTGGQRVRISHPGLVLFLLELSFDDAYFTGGCIGFDKAAGKAMRILYPKSKHVVIVPHNTYKVDYWWLQYPDVIETKASGPTFKHRNQDLVNNADRLVYCAEYPEDHPKSLRSGTWQTVRLARLANLPIEGLVLNPDG